MAFFLGALSLFLGIFAIETMKAGQKQGGDAIWIAFLVALAFLVVALGCAYWAGRIVP